MSVLDIFGESIQWVLPSGNNEIRGRLDALFVTASIVLVGGNGPCDIEIFAGTEIKHSRETIILFTYDLLRNETEHKLGLYSHGTCCGTCGTRAYGFSRKGCNNV